MKKVIFGFVSFLLSANVHASMLPEYRSALVDFHMQPGTELQNVNTGDVSIALVTNEIRLNLTQTVHIMCFRAPCPQPHIAFPEHNINVKITDIKKGSCGETIYVGKDFSLPVDGSNITVQVIDNSSNNCETFQALPAVEVRLDIVPSRGGKTEHHKMIGSAFFELK